MDIRTIKLDLINWLINLKDESILDRITSIKNDSSRKDWYDELSEKDKESIQKGLDDIANGRIIPNDQVMVKIKSKINHLKNS